MNKISHHEALTKHLASNEPQLRFSLYSSSDNTHHGFSVPAHMTVADFLEFALEHLAKGEGSERVQELRTNYQPVLELSAPDGDRELPADQSLLEAGVYERAICRIAARLRKDRVLFCRYTNYS